jgi:outer membrane receptor protein involved in Fe transport
VAAATAAVPTYATTFVAEEDEAIDLGSLEDEDSEQQEGSEGGSTEDDPSGDVADQLAAGSGVRVSTICTNCNAASVTVNGLSGDRVGVTWDGVSSPGGLASVYWLSQFPGDFIGYTGVTRGPGSVLSGPAAFAGTIDFHTLERKERRTWLDLHVGDWGFRQLRAAGTEKWGPVGALVFVQGATEDVYDADDKTPNEVAEFDRFSYHGLVDFQLNEEQVLTLDASYYGEAQIDGPGAPEFYNDEYLAEDAFFNWRRGAIHWDLTKPSGLHVELKTSYSLRKHRQSAPVFSGQPKETTYRIEEEFSTGEARVGRPVGTAGFLTGGVSWDRQRLFVKQAGYLVLDDPEWIIDGLEQLGAYMQYERSVGSAWDFTVGARVDRMTVFGKTNTDGESEWLQDAEIEHTYFIPRAQMHYRPNGKVVLGLSAGRGIGGSRPVAEETCCGARYVRNRELGSERAWSYQGQVEWKPTPDQRFTTTAFWTDFTDYHEKVVYSSNGFIPYYKKENIQDARVRGLDFVHDMRFKGDLINVGWTWTITDADGEYTYPGSERNPEMWKIQGLRYIPKHAASAYFRYNHVGRGTQFNADLSYTSSMSHFRLGKEGDDFGTRLEDEPWQFLESEDFVQLSLYFEQRIGKKGWSAYVGVNNVTDYIMPDLGEFESSYDWGPIQGRYIYGGAKFNR